MPLSSTLGGSNILKVNPTSNGCLVERNKEKKTWLGSQQNKVQYLLDLVVINTTADLFVCLHGNGFRKETHFMYRRLRGIAQGSCLSAMLWHLEQKKLDFIMEDQRGVKVSC
jgi:hypothetical protein